MPRMVRPPPQRCDPADVGREARLGCTAHRTSHGLRRGQCRERLDRDRLARAPHAGRRPRGHPRPRPGGDPQPRLRPLRQRPRPRRQAHRRRRAAAARVRRGARRAAGPRHRRRRPRGRRPAARDAAVLVQPLLRRGAPRRRGRVLAARLRAHGRRRSGSSREVMVNDIAGRVDGLAVLAQTVPDDLLAHVSRRIPVVVLADSRRSTASTTSASTTPRACATSASHVHRRGPASGRSSTSRVRSTPRTTGSGSTGFAAGARGPRRCPGASVRVEPGDFCRARAREPGRRCSPPPTCPQAVVCANDQSALGVLDASVAHGARRAGGRRRDRASTASRPGASRRRGSRRCASRWATSAAPRCGPSSTGWTDPRGRRSGSGCPSRSCCARAARRRCTGARSRTVPPRRAARARASNRMPNHAAAFSVQAGASSHATALRDLAPRCDRAPPPARCSRRPGTIARLRRAMYALTLTRCPPRHEEIEPRR